MTAKVPETLAGLNLVPMDGVEEDFGRWLIHGPQGSGKSTLASSIAALGPTLYIDLTGERGVRSFKGADYSSNIRVVRPSSITDLDDIYWALNAGDHPFVAVVIDSVTSVQKMTMRYLLGHDETAVREIKQGTAPADMRTWGQSLDVMTDLFTFWFGLADGSRPKPIHVVMTAQTKVTEDDVTGTTMRTPDVQRGALSFALATPDYILYTDLEDNPDAIGDDSVPDVLHIVRFGNSLEYRTKARVPFDKRGKIPTILGRRNPPSLLALSTALGIGGIPKPKRAPAKKAASPEQPA